MKIVTFFPIFSQIAVALLRSILQQSYQLKALTLLERSDQKIYSNDANIRLQIGVAKGSPISNSVIFQCTQCVIFAYNQHGGYHCYYFMGALEEEGVSFERGETVLVLLRQGNMEFQCPSLCRYYNFKELQEHYAESIILQFYIEDSVTDELKSDLPIVD